MRNSWEYITDSTESTNRRSVPSFKVQEELYLDNMTIISLSHENHFKGMQPFFLNKNSKYLRKNMRLSFGI